MPTTPDWTGRDGIGNTSPWTSTYYPWLSTSYPWLSASDSWADRDGNYPN